MSAFVVEPKTINRVLTHLRDALNKREWFAEQAERELNKIEFSLAIKDGPGGESDCLPELGQAMYNLNIRGVSQRYPDCKKADDLPGSISDDGGLVPYSYGRVEANQFQALKSLRCWHYQCTEGNAPDTALYKAFDRISDMMSYHIVTNLPEYDKAEWA